jgi:hypothetical protein
MAAAFACLLIGLALGTLAGVSGLTILYVRSLKNPETAQKMLREAYKAAHPHWLVRSQTDSRRVCPLCGWTEDEAKP